MPLVHFPVASFNIFFIIIIIFAKEKQNLYFKVKLFDQSLQGALYCKVKTLQ